MKPGARVWIFLSFILIAIIGCQQKSNNPAKFLLVNFIDVGYGDSIFIEFPDDSNMLIDAGNLEAAQAVLKFLDEKRLKRLDAIIITHSDEDHLGGILAVLQKHGAGIIITNDNISNNQNYAALYNSVKDKKVKLSVVRRGNLINSSNAAKIEVLHPDRLKGTSNDSSIVIKLTYKKVSFLLSSDIGPQVCNQLIASYGKKLKSNILKVPWHGRTKSEEFIRMVNPHLAIISVGPSQWPAPAEDVLADFKKFNIHLLRTDAQGTITVGSDGKKFWYSTQKHRP